MWYEMVEQLLKQLMTLLQVDTSYFVSRVPVVKDIAVILLAVGWALLIGNLAYQALRSMVSGVGIEAEEPGRLFLRSAMFSFLLVCSRQICNLALNLSSVIMQMLQVPQAVTFTPFNEDFFSTLPNAGWLVVIVVNVYIQWQIIKLFFEVAERYVILCVLIYCAPLAFAMGGSKSTAEIFRGWLRMFASMCTLMVLNVVFVKMLLSAMSNSPTGAAIVPWVMLITGIVRVAKKMDSIILRIGLNPASTGDPLGHFHVPGMLSAMMIQHAATVIRSTITNPPHASGTAQPRYDGPLAYGADRQIASERSAEISTSAGSSTQTNASEHSSDRYRQTSAGSAFGTGRPQRTSAVRKSHPYADINIEADDFVDGSSVQSVSSTASSAFSRISPLAPPIQRLPHDFAAAQPITPVQTARPPIAPSVQHTQNAMQSAQNTPQNIVHHVDMQNRTESQITENGSEQNTAIQPQTIEHSASIETAASTHGQQSGRISPVTPPRPAAARETQNSTHTSAGHSASHTQHDSIQKTVRQVQEQSVSSAVPVTPKVSQVDRTVRDRAPVQRQQNTEAITEHTSASQRSVAPVRQENTQTIHQNTPVSAVKPDRAPQRNRGASTAARADISPVSARKPSIEPQRTGRKPHDPVSPVSQPRALRRTAEPIRPRDITPGNGGERNAKRKRKP